MTIDHEKVIHALNTHAQYGTCVLGGKICGYFTEEKCTASLAKDAEALIIGMMEQILEAHSCLHCAKDSRCDPNADPDTQAHDTFYQCRHGSIHKENWVWKGVERDEMR